MKLNQKFVLALLVAITLLVTACGSSTPASNPTRVPAAKLVTTLVCDTACTATVKNVGDVKASVALEFWMEEPDKEINPPPKQNTSPAPTPNVVRERLDAAYGKTATPTMRPTAVPDRRNYRNTRSLKI